MTAQDAATISAEDIEAIKAQSRSYVATSLIRDFDSWVELSTPDAVFMPPNSQRQEGRETLRAWANQLPEITGLTVTPVDIEGRGDLAFVRGTYTFTFVPPDMDEVSMQGNYIEIWKK